MAEVNFDKMTDKELTAYTHKAASNLSYYNAAEGDMWKKEEADRAEALGAYRRGRDAMAERGIEWENKGYLI